MIVKICGITRPEDARAAVAAGADWIGINFWPRSRRYVGDLTLAREIAEAAGDATVVGVFVNQTVEEIDPAVETAGLDRVQLHGDEEPAFCRRVRGAVKAVSLATAADVERIAGYDCDVVLVDTPTPGYGGSGRTGNWELARAAVAVGPRILLAGGLTAENVADAIAAVTPWGVDVAGGVEGEPGIKDAERMRRFCAAAKGAV